MTEVNPPSKSVRKPQGGRARGGKAGSPEHSGEPLDERLQSLYAPVLDEPLPEDMLRLLQPQNERT